MPDDTNEADENAPGRFKVRSCENVDYMMCVVWDTVRDRPVAYSAGWVDACMAARRWEAHPPHDPTSLV